MQRSRNLAVVAIAASCSLWLGCGESRYANLPDGERQLAEFCDGLGGAVVTEGGKIVGIEFTGDVENVTDQSLAQIAKASNVTTLMLVSTQVTDAGLAQLESLSNLETLDVSGSEKITNAGLEHVKQMSSLRKFICRGCDGIKPAARDELREHFKQNHGRVLLITGP